MSFGLFYDCIKHQDLYFRPDVQLEGDRAANDNQWLRPQHSEPVLELKALYKNLFPKFVEALSGRNSIISSEKEWRLVKRILVYRYESDCSEPGWAHLD